MKPSQKHRTRRAPAPAAVFAASALAAITLISSCSGKKPDPDAALIVNGLTVTHGEINEIMEIFRMERMRASPERIFDGSASDALRQGAARQLAANALMLEAVNAMGWEAPEAEVDAMANRLVSRFGSREAFLAQLAAMGESEEAMRKDIAESILLDSLAGIVSRVDPIEDSEARAKYEENKSRYAAPGRVRASHIVFAFDIDPEDTSTEAMSGQMAAIMSKAAEAQARAKAGEDFDMLIKAYARPPAPGGGDLGWFGRGELQGDLERALFPLKKGEISGLVPSPMGIHVLKKTDEEEPRQMSYEEAAPGIKRTLEMMKREAKVNGYIDSLLSAADIKYIDKTLIPPPPGASPPSAAAMPAPAGAGETATSAEGL
jgi:peptidyl-prolyl cis-trans isomerase C